MADPYAGLPSTDDIGMQRRLAQQLMGQGMDSSPVGHWTQALARVLQGGVGGMYQAQAAQGEKDRGQAIVKALQGSQNLSGLSEGEQGLLAANPDLMRTVAGNVMTARLSPPKPTDDIREYEYAKQRGFQGSLQDWLVNKRATAGEYSKTPVYGTRTGANGQPETVMLQPGSRGDAAETKLPPGVSVNAQKPIQIDAGTHTIILDPITRQPIGQVQKDIAGKERAEEIGKAGGKAAADLPRVVDNAQQTLKVIDQALNHKGFDRNFGPAGLIPNWPGSEAADAWTFVEQLKGRTFLEAFNSLRGGGAITEAEGQKATDAYARLQRPQSAKAAREALQDLREVVDLGVRRARHMAGLGTQQKDTEVSRPLPRVKSAEEARSLPKGTRFVAPDGRIFEVE